MAFTPTEETTGKKLKRAGQTKTLRIEIANSGVSKLKQGLKSEDLVFYCIDYF